MTYLVTTTKTILWRSGGPNSVIKSDAIRAMRASLWSRYYVTTRSTKIVKKLNNYSLAQYVRWESSRHCLILHLLGTWRKLTVFKYLTVLTHAISAILILFINLTCLNMKWLILSHINARNVQGPFPSKKMWSITKPRHIQLWYSCAIFAKRGSVTKHVKMINSECYFTWKHFKNKWLGWKLQTKSFSKVTIVKLNQGTPHNRKYRR